ncbi:ComEC/Rec2 family competence protein [Zunongwangia endophytica]|uniref:ComEC/Rec2 family competence protein n=1 Tax=Zunongwangia endophytica TaxID=1808945 RepID=A0ABV8HDR6_9FLAO|nr:ComEC/Rec2 family competence protein [Zunongwangia endophytica]MDN3596333.1 ComEC/Rec2 family competence protein [Zunongwangia endophytica]
MGYTNIKILKFSIAVLCGILTAHYTQIALSYFLISAGITILFFLLSFFRSARQLYQKSYFGVCCYVLLFLFGSISYQLKFPENQHNYFSHFITSENDLLSIKLKEELKPNFQKRFIAEVDHIISSENTLKAAVKGNILIAVPLQSEIEVGQQLIIPASVKPIKSPLNPHQFDYSEYMKFQGIFHQIQLSEDQILFSKNLETSFIENPRTRLLKSLNSSGFEKEELAVIKALILGDRTSISNEIYSKYASAGAIHILAVSGLHVGIVLLLLNFILKPIRQLKWLKFLLTLAGIWGFAILTGFSASVVRASLMFSLIAFGLQINRKVNLLNTLFSAFFVLILINPFYVFQVGFQLSFAAVFSIALFQPKFNKLWYPNNKLIRLLYQTLTVSICAQIGVLPLSLFYFHQFPGLFLLTNIVILPGLGVLLISGIFILILSVFGILPKMLIDLYSFLIEKLNQYISWIASQETFIIREINLSVPAVIFLFGIILSTFFALQHKKKKYIFYVFCGIILFQISMLFEQFEHSSEEFFILNKSGSTVIAEKKSQNLTLYGNNEKDTNWQYLKNFKLHEKISNIEVHKLQNFYLLKEKRILLIDSTGLYNFPKFNPDILLLSNSPKVNLKRVIEVLDPPMIMADASNYQSFIQLWRATCANKKIPFYHTGKKGAFNY